MLLCVTDWLPTIIKMGSKVKMRSIEMASNVHLVYMSFFLNIKLASALFFTQWAGSKLPKSVHGLLLYIYVLY